MMTPIIDIHTHLAGLGQGGTQCFIAPRKFNSPLYRLMRAQLGIYLRLNEAKVPAIYGPSADETLGF